MSQEGMESHLNDNGKQQELLVWPFILYPFFSLYINKAFSYSVRLHIVSMSQTVSQQELGMLKRKEVLWGQEAGKGTDARSIHCLWHHGEGKVTYGQNLLHWLQS